MAVHRANEAPVLVLHERDFSSEHSLQETEVEHVTYTESKKKTQ